MSIENMSIIIHMVLNMSVPLTNILLRNTGTTCTGAARLFEDVSICAGALPDFDRMNKRCVLVGVHTVDTRAHPPLAVNLNRH